MQRQGGRAAGGRIAFVVCRLRILEGIQKRHRRWQNRKDECPVAVMVWVREANYPSRQIRNPNIEFRNKSEARNPKSKTFLFGSLGSPILNLFRISDFEFRI
jgi:hypothetical protein